KICQSKQIQAPAKQQNPKKQQQARAAVDVSVERKREKRDCVYKLVKHRLVPDVDHPPPLKHRSQTMCSKCSQRDCKETKHSCYSKKEHGYFLLGHYQRSRGICKLHSLSDRSGFVTLRLATGINNNG